MTSSRITLIFGFIRLLISTSTVFAQPVNNYVKDVSMPAPNAAALGKYGDYSVSNFTGVPDISIPIYTVTEGLLSLPISLSYHASGIKAAEMASWVGAGWSLNCGGIITRTVQGLKDEHANGYYNTATLLETRVNAAGSNSSLNGQLNEDIANGVIDGEPDIFSFNVSGYTGKFYIDKNHDVQFIPKQDLMIKIDGTLEGFTLIALDGTRYVFGRDGDNYAQEKTVPEGISDPYTTSWYLLKVETADKLYKINLTYGDESYNYLSAASVKWNVNIPIGNGNIKQEYSYASTNGDVYHTTHKTNMFGKKLVKITSSTDSINFVAMNTREDLDGVTKSLDKIEIFTGSKCQKFDFLYSYFQDQTSTITYSPTSSVAKKLRLESLRQTSCDNSIIIPPHLFSYNGNFLVHRLSKAIDHWGFYNGASGNETMITNIPPTTVTSAVAETPTISHGNANRESNETEMLKGVLTQIEFPTGGTTTFTFEANTASTFGRLVTVPVYTLASCSSPISFDCCGTGTNGQKLITGTYRPTTEDIQSGTFVLALDKLSGDNGSSPCPIYDPATYIYVFNGTTRVGSLSLVLRSGQSSDASPVYSLSYLGIIDTTVTYSFELYATNSYATFKMSNAPFVVSNKVVGGLRIKEIKTFDGVSMANDIVKQYNYNVSATSSSTSGILLKQPKYGYDIGASQLNSSSCATGYGVLITFNDESIVPLYTFEGNHLGYTTVREIHVGNGSKLYKFNLDLPTLSGNPIYNYNFIYPTPPYDPVVSNGQINQFHVVSNDGGSIKSTNNNTNAETPTYSAGKIRKVVKHFFPSTISPSLCTNPVVWAQLATDYRIKTQPFRLQSVIETLDRVQTITNYTYSNDAAQPLFPLTVSMKNSDEKTTITTNKYVTHADYATDTIYRKLKALNIIANPVEVTTSVEGLQVNGAKIKYGFFELLNGLPTTNPINTFPYPYQFYKYKMTWDANGVVQINNVNNGWDLEATITKYSPTKAKPESVNLRAWENATEANATEKYTWETNGLIKTRQFKGFTWKYEYFPNTRLVSKITNRDGQFESYMYDDLLRAKQALARNGQVKTEFVYAYKDITQFNRNWIKTKITFGATIGGTLSNNTTYKTVLQYLDGLGRIVQNVAVANSPDYKDVVSIVEYDNQGRESKKYDPYESLNSTGAFVAMLPTNYPATVMEYQASPLNRIEKTTPPNNWQSTITEYGTNVGTEVLDVSGNIAFSANTLNKIIITDPNGRVQSIFTDKKGRKIFILNSQNNVGGGTYMMYGFDDKDRPNKIITPRSAPEESTMLNDLDYSYLYDWNDNMTQKKQPDIAAVSMIYNARNQMILMRDGKQLAGNQWFATLYDSYGRPYTTGFATNTNLDSTFNPTLATTLNITDYYSAVGISFGKVMRTKNYQCAFLESYFEYDNYGRLSTTYSNSQMYSPRGIISPTNFSEKTALSYDLADNVLTKTRTHKPNATSTMTILETMEYDNGLRLKQVRHKVNAMPEQILSYSDFNVKNQLATKRIGKAGGLNYLQKVDYTYNALGWLTGINSPNALSGTTTALSNCTLPSDNALSSASLDVNDLFSLELKYENPDASLAPNGTSVTPQYGGNISQVVWQVRGREKQAYTLNYDALNRMTDAIYSDISTSGNVTGNRFDEKLTYDSRGNINSLKRWGLTSNCNWGLIDDLVYNYGSIGYNISNKLNSLTDNSDLTRGFKTIANGIAYTYDTNGNVTSDMNKGIINITYNHMNLPITTTYSNGNKIEFKYDSWGNKLRKTVSGATANYVQNYLGGIEYKGTTLEAIYHSEGRVTNINGTLMYEYALKDHLGNTRLMFSDKNGVADGKITQSPDQTVNEVTQENHYYPFGLNMEGVWSNTPSVLDSKYQHSGKELNDDFGLGLIDFGARSYEPATGRWTTFDPMAEKMRRYSPYAYVFNNPMRFIDPDGMKADDHFFDSKGEYLGSTEIGNDIRIVNEGATFEEAATDPSSSMLLTEKNYSKNNVSNVQILSKIATYYANKVGIDQKIEVGYPGKAGGFAYTELQSDQIFMMVDDNGKINEKASDANNLMNSLEHEDGHVKDHSTAKPLAHAMLSVKQMGFDSFKGTTQAFKAVVPSYIMTNLNEAIDKGITLDKVQNVIDLANKYTPQTGYELFINEQTHKVEQIGVLGSIEIIGKKN